MQISKYKKNIPGPLPNPGYAPDNIWHIYRPAPFQQNEYNVNCFLDEFAEFLFKSTFAKSEISILGDDNIHLVDVKTNRHCSNMDIAIPY